MLFFAFPVNHDPIRFRLLTLLEAEIRLALDKQEDVVDHVRVAHGEVQILAGLQLLEGFMALEHADRPNDVAQIDFHRVLILIQQ
jgi:hypothetical protein